MVLINKNLEMLRCPVDARPLVAESRDESEDRFLSFDAIKRQQFAEDFVLKFSNHLRRSFGDSKIVFSKYLFEQLEASARNKRTILAESWLTVGVRFFAGPLEPSPGLEYDLVDK